MTAIRVKVVVLLFAYLVVQGEASAAGLPLPGGDVAQSPDRKWELSSTPPVADEGHKLLLTSRSDGSARVLFLFPRHIEVLWAPDSKHVAITDYSGSDIGDCKIVDVESAKAISVTDAIRKTELAPFVAKNHHAFVKCLTWHSQEVIGVQLDAYGDLNPNGVKKHVRFNILRATFIYR